MRIAPTKNINANVQDIKVCPTPNKIPAIFPYFTANFNASSSYFPYFVDILYYRLQLLTVLMYIIDVMTSS